MQSVILKLNETSLILPSVTGAYKSTRNMGGKRLLKLVSENKEGGRQMQKVRELNILNMCVL